MIKLRRADNGFVYNKGKLVTYRRLFVMSQLDIKFQVKTSRTKHDVTRFVISRAKREALCDGIL